MSADTISIKLKEGNGVVLYIPATHEFKLIPFQKQDQLIKFYKSDLELSSSQEKITSELEANYSAMEEKRLSRIPVIGFCILTNKCNMNCSFCYADKNSDGFEGKFKIEWIEHLKTILPDSSFDECNFSGGEPLLEFELVKQLRPYFKNVTIYTNGSLIDRDIAEWLIETNTKIYVNLDYEIKDFEGHASKNVRANLQLLINEFPLLKELIEISIVLQPKHISDLQDLRKQKEDFESDIKHEFNFVKGGIIDKEACIKEIKGIESGELDINSSCFLRQMRYIKVATEFGMNIESCDPSITINYRGDIMLCHEFASSYTEPYYSKNKVSAIEDFTTEKYLKKILELRKKGACKETTCLARWFCGGICWANINVNPYLCDVSRTLLPYALYLAINYGDLDFTEAFNKNYITSITMR